MARYTPQVGGYRWTQLLVGNRQRTREVVEILKRLHGAASTDATRVIILQAQVMCTECLVELEQLLVMARGGGESSSEQ
jgi:alkylated DNA nucleotide flippase Atl1